MLRCQVQLGDRVRVYNAHPALDGSWCARNKVRLSSLNSSDLDPNSRLNKCRLLLNVSGARTVSALCTTIWINICSTTLWTPTCLHRRKCRQPKRKLPPCPPARIKCRYLHQDSKSSRPIRRRRQSRWTARHTIGYDAIRRLPSRLTLRSALCGRPGALGARVKVNVSNKMAAKCSDSKCLVDHVRLACRTINVV
jgi:hypothetical protein